MDWGFRWEGPPIESDATFFQKDGDVFVHILNQPIRNNNGVVVPIQGSKLRCTKYNPTEVKLVYPREETLEFDGDVINIPPVSIHNIIALKL